MDEDHDADHNNVDYDHDGHGVCGATRYDAMHRRRLQSVLVSCAVSQLLFLYIY